MTGVIFLQVWHSSAGARRLLYGLILDHSSFSGDGIEQIVFENRADHEPVNANELTRLRGVLGALQWPTHQTNPLISAGGDLESRQQDAW